MRSVRFQNSLWTRRGAEESLGPNKEKQVIKRWSRYAIFSIYKHVEGPLARHDARWIGKKKKSMMFISIIFNLISSLFPYLCLSGAHPVWFLRDLRQNQQPMWPPLPMPAVFFYQSYINQQFIRFCRNIFDFVCVLRNSNYTSW